MKKSVLFVMIFVLFFCCLCGSFYAEDLYVIESKEEYDRFLAETELPSGFVPYESISFLGEFQEFKWSDGYKEYYNYSVKCPEKEGFHTIYCYLESSPVVGRGDSAILSLPEKGDLQNLPLSGGEGPFDWANYYQIGDFYYRYTCNGVEFCKLRSMDWYNADKSLQFSISFSCGSDMCDFRKELMGFNTAPRAVNRLLSATGGEPVPLAENSTTDITSPNGMDAASTSTDTPADPSPFPWLWVIVPAGVVLIAAAATTVLVLRKKKKSE